MIKRLFKYLVKSFCILKIKCKRMFYNQLFILISTPYYGNVGDHAILLQEKKILRSCGIKGQIIDFSSLEYRLLSDDMKKIISNEDVIIIDGGGNFGDTWPETTYQILDIIIKYKNNKIIIFPESWYYSESPLGEKILKDTRDAFIYNKNVVIYARDSWSYNEMVKSIKSTTVRYSYDTVLLQGIFKSTKSDNIKRVGMCIREDKESQNKGISDCIISELNKRNVEITKISNDSYKHIPKIKRQSYVNSILKKYNKCDLIITDRFHGFIFSLILQKPCIIIDNNTGKIKHFYTDIEQYISGYRFVENCSCVEDVINSIFNDSNTNIDKTLLKNIYDFKKDIKDTIKHWRKNI